MSEDSEGTEKSIDKGLENRKESEYHEPVMFRETLEWLVTKDDGLYIDGTLGGGGHAAGILRKVSNSGRLICFDADEQAISFCRGAFADELARGEESRIRLVHGNYAEVCGNEEVVAGSQKGISGLLLDLGVSSYQLNNPAQGISHRYDAALDMRFGGSGRTAAEIINSAEQAEIQKILWEFGEEKFARNITKAIVQRRRIAPITTTVELRKLVEETVPPPVFLSSLARVFQALRIAVNHELEVLEKTLLCVIPMLAPGGRIVVISYHSLEDRIVKHIFKKESTSHRPSYPGDVAIHARLKLLTPKPQLPSEEEVRRNPRARSAKVRVVERVA